MDSNIKGWLLTILRNGWLNQLRRRRNGPEMVQMELGDGVATDIVQAFKGPHDVCVDKIKAEQVRAAIEDLPILFREVILLREYENLLYHEMASVLDCPIGTVMSRLARARASFDHCYPRAPHGVDNHFYCVDPRTAGMTPAINRGPPFRRHSSIPVFTDTRTQHGWGL
jgi:RNA polymerase sigma factor (sigma-70 family)